MTMRTVSEVRVGDDLLGRPEAVESRHPDVHQHDVRPARSARGTASEPSAASPTTSRSARASRRARKPARTRALVVGEQQPGSSLGLQRGAGPGPGSLPRDGEAASRAPPSAVARPRMPSIPVPTADPGGVISRRNLRDSGSRCRRSRPGRHRAVLTAISAHEQIEAAGFRIWRPFPGELPLAAATRSCSWTR